MAQRYAISSARTSTQNQKHLEQQNKNIQEVLQQSATSITKVANMPQHEEQWNFTFAEMVNAAPLPKDRPLIIINPKENGITFPKMKKILNNLSTQDLPKIDCQSTRQNKIIITCNDKQDLGTIKNKLLAVEDITENLEIKDQ